VHPRVGDRRDVERGALAEREGVSEQRGADQRDARVLGEVEDLQRRALGVRAGAGVLQRRQRVDDEVERSKVAHEGAQVRDVGRRVLRASAQ